jgi:hypothetical protein
MGSGQAIQITKFGTFFLPKVAKQKNRLLGSRFLVHMRFRLISEVIVQRRPHKVHLARNIALDNADRAVCVVAIIDVYFSNLR